MYSNESSLTIVLWDRSLHDINIEFHGMDSSDEQQRLSSSKKKKKKKKSKPAA